MPIINVIEYEGDNRTFVWKHPATDFNTKSQLIVHESQQALFFYEGRVQDVFGPGRYTLETQNIPFLTAAGAVLISGGISPFHAEVYFVNQAEQLGIPWGTSSKVTYIEPQYGFPLEIGASGEMGLRVIPERVSELVVRLVGTEAMASQTGLLNYFRGFLQMRVKNALATTIKEQQLSIFEMDMHLEELSQMLRARLSPDFEEYGLQLTQFIVSTIAKPEGNREYERFKQLYFRQYADIRDAQIRQQVSVIESQTEAQQTVIGAQAQAQKRQIEGYTYQQERGFDVAQAAASNESVGQFASLGVGMGLMGGVGMGIGGAVSQSIGQSMGSAQMFPTPAQQPPVQATPTCPTCGAEVMPSWKVCPECGTSLRPPVCANCGMELKPSWKVCPECGTPRG